MGASRVLFDGFVGGECLGGWGIIYNRTLWGGWRELFYFFGETIEFAASARWSAGGGGHEVWVGVEPEASSSFG